MKKLCLLFFIFLLASNGFAQYKQPPKEIEDILNAPVTPITLVSPAKDKILLAEPLRYPPISELAQPMLRLAGLRINPNTNGQHRQLYFVKLSLKNISEGKETPISLPTGAQIISPNWSADGKYIAVGNVTSSGIELWIVETATAKATELKNVQVNTVFGGFEWMPDQKSLIVNLVPSKRSAAPIKSDVPTEPSIQETVGKTGAVQTFQDLLKSPTDEKMFEYYATSQLAVVGVDGKIKEIGQSAIFDNATVSPDGKYILTSRIQHPFSYLFPSLRFPKEVEVLDFNGKMIYKLASIPLQDNLPVQGVTTAPRSFDWIPTESATLAWAEALDGGNPKNKVMPRDKLMKLAAPFTAQPTEIVKTEQRYQGRQFGEKDGLMLFYDYNRDTQHRRVFMMDYRSNSAPKMISDLNINDRYNDIGQPVLKTLANGERVIQQNGDEIFLTGQGASPEGDRPFLRRFDLRSMEVPKRGGELFRSSLKQYESFVTLLNNEGTGFITRIESNSEPPNLWAKSNPGFTVDGVMDGIVWEPKKLTNFTDPTPQLRGITKQLVKYKRADGVDLSFTLYLPAEL